MIYFSADQNHKVLQASLTLEEMRELLVQSFEGVFELLDQLVEQYYPEEV